MRNSVCCPAFSCCATNGIKPRSGGQGVGLSQASKQWLLGVRWPHNMGSKACAHERSTLLYCRQRTGCGKGFACDATDAWMCAVLPCIACHCRECCMHGHFMACEMSACDAYACMCGTHIVGYVHACAQMSHSCTAAHLLAATWSMFLLIIDMPGYASVREHHCYAVVRGRGRQTTARRCLRGTNRQDRRVVQQWWHMLLRECSRPRLLLACSMRCYCCYHG